MRIIEYYIDGILFKAIIDEPIKEKPMPQIGYVLNPFFTPSGVIAELGFEGKIIPAIGSIFERDDKVRWRMIERSFELKSTSKVFGDKYNRYRNVWDCRLEPVEHSELLKIDDVLRIL